MKKTLLVILAILVTPALLAQTPAAPDCAAMMKSMQDRHQHMNDMNTKLQGLVDAMNKAEGPARVDKMAAVINELVAQRSMMMKEMMDMQPQMMEHMMAHMQGSMSKGASDAMNCPMMKGSASEHSEHH